MKVERYRTHSVKRGPSKRATGLTLKRAFHLVADATIAADDARQRKDVEALDRLVGILHANVEALQKLAAATSKRLRRAERSSR